MSGPELTLNPQGPGTSFSGPVIVGSRASGNTAFPQGGNQGIVELTQVVQLTQNSTNAVSQTVLVPKHSQIIDFLVDTPTPWNSATSATLSVGTTAADTSYLSGITQLTTVTTGSARVYPTTYSESQLTNMLDTGSNELVVFTVTPVGATSAGSTFVTMRYRMTQNYQNP